MTRKRRPEAALGSTMSSLPDWASADPPAPENGAQLLADIRRFVARFVVAPAPALDVIPVWIVHAHAIEAADASPYLHVTGPELRCGKSRLLAVLRLLVPTPLPAATATPAAVFRALGHNPPPVLLLDEVDALFGRRREQREGSEDLRALLNAGWQRGTPALRCVGPAHEVRAFPVFGAKALAGIGELPPTLADRSLRIRMDRLTPGERVERLLDSRPPTEAAELCERAAAWAGEHLDELRYANPAIPEDLDDRGADGSLALFAIADLAGGDWPVRTRAAVVELRSGDAAEASESYGVVLLGAVRRAFEAAGNPAALGTAELLAAVAEDNEAPAGFSMEDTGRPRRLARSIRPYEVKPRDVWREGRSVKGYAYQDLEPAWGRYCAPNPREAREPFSGAILTPAKQGEDIALPRPSESRANPEGKPVLAYLALSEQGNGRDERVPQLPPDAPAWERAYWARRLAEGTAIP
jgi:hypothetical protein